MLNVVVFEVFCILWLLLYFRYKDNFALLASLIYELCAVLLLIIK